LLPGYEVSISSLSGAVKTESRLDSNIVTLVYIVITISIIIPVLNEASNLSRVLPCLAFRPEVEIVVVDGGSQDGSADVAGRYNAKVIHTTPGRAQQMNLGAANAEGKILLFLHADTGLPEQFQILVEQTLTRPGVIAGAFDLKINGRQWGLRWVEWGVYWRSRLCQLPYGDQAIFLTVETFHTLGGFPDLPIMEDFVFVQHLKKLGQVAMAPASVLTSGRRWQRHGVLKTTLVNQIIILGYVLKVPTQTLARWYKRLK